MTKDKDFKLLVRKRMSSTGENFTSARTALLNDQRHHDERHEDQSRSASTLADPEAEAFKAKTLRTFMSGGRLVSIPTKRKALVVILLEMLTAFETGRTYSEKDINTILSEFHPDFARLRRELIDYGYLGRDAHTGQYWVNSPLPARTGNLIQEAAVFEAFLR
ncbi:MULTISPECIES: DUF2087 domain-containing protein [Brevibacterium]|uniref:DUF2087 domain-containing protein n=2 Tax=Brevibacterium TaxID=1696 RepID=A0A1H1L9C2_BRESA|nr:DUF2087 domain-containing protein [Brevibacterium sandarakinum]SDR70882.1 hypothetical protein SAMN04489751_0161 [Brevibacterium sandarakinum]